MTEAVPPRIRLGDLSVRLASAVVLATIALLSVWLGGSAFAVIWCAVAVALLAEWQHLIGGERLVLRALLGAVGLIAIALAAGAGRMSWAAFGAGGLAAVEALIATERRLWAACGGLYAGGFLYAVLSLRLAPLNGALAMLWLFALVWGTDTFAYFGGRLIGGPKIWPRVSPSKTWSGTLVGIGAGGLVGAASASVGLGRTAAFLPLMLLSVVAAFISQAGDAAESAMKRRFNVKDSSRLIPGHGGVMDRLDGFVAASLFAVAVGASRDPQSVTTGLFSWS